MKRKILLLATIILIALPIAISAQMTYVPDDNFEQYLIWIGLDSGPLNDSVPTKNIDTIIELNTYYYKISDLTGIEGFKSLKSLICFNCGLNKINLSYNYDLETLKCSNNNLRALNVSKNYKLKELHCSYNQIPNLDVSNNPYLYSLSFDSNPITTIDVSKNTDLYSLQCHYTQITSLDISLNPKIISILCYANSLTSLNLKNGHNEILNLDAYNNPYLACIQVDDTSLANISKWQIDSTSHYSENCNYTAVEDNKFENEAAAISPNPAHDYIELSLPPRPPGEGRGEGFRIYNTLGEIVSGLDTPPDPLFLEGGKCRIDVSALPQGTYFIRFGGEIRKFIKF